MTVQVLSDPEALARAVARLLADTMKIHPEGLYCMAAGDTPRRTYVHLATLLKREGFDPSRLRFVALDEWRGLGPDSPGGCRAFLREALFGPLGIGADQIAFFDALAPDPVEDCRRIDRWIADHGPLTTAVLGIGMNGHLGFNEPGTPADSPTRPVDLDATTQRVGAKYFPDGRVPVQGLTLGLDTLMKACHVVVLATGSAKAGIARAARNPGLFPEVPAAVLNRHPDARLFIDAVAGV